MDMDLYCRRSLEPLRQFDFVAPAAYPKGVSNGFIMSRPNLPFLREVITKLVDYDLDWFGLPYATVSFTTGCHFLSYVSYSPGPFLLFLFPLTTTGPFTRRPKRIARSCASSGGPGTCTTSTGTSSRPCSAIWGPRRGTAGTPGS
jgi:hypothetical protein